MVHCASVLYIMFTFIHETYTAIQARSLEISLDFFNSLQRAKRSTQNWWLRKQKERHFSSHRAHPHFLFEQNRCSTHFSSVVKISKQLLASIWLSILRKGIVTLKKEKKKLSYIEDILKWTFCGYTRKKCKQNKNVKFQIKRIYWWKIIYYK